MISNALRRWKQTRRIARAEAEIMGRRVDQQAHGLRAPLVISLTSYPARFGSLHLVLRSLLNQTVRADRVILWLDEGDQARVTPEIAALDIETRICPNWRSYKKIVPTLIEAPGAYIVTADDDVYYGPDWLAGLVAQADAGVVSHRAHRVVLRDGAPAGYDDWQRNIDAPDAGPLIFPTGVGGVLYAPGVFHPEVTDAARFGALAPMADDVWLYWMHRLAGSRPVKIGGSFRITEWPGTQTQSLRVTNLSGDGNDRAIGAMLARYGWPG